MSSSSSSSSSPSSSSEAKRPFDVFINFRGGDVRDGFVADLHSCLIHGKINAYIDNEDLRPGDEISPALMKAIEESRIAVLVFSENYASSRWCLDELVKVMECRRLKNQRVLPVFYKVKPEDIRWLKRSYGDALARHEERLGNASERVKKWREALKEAANLSGWHHDHGDATEFIERIVKKISTIVKRVPLSVAKYPVGVHCRVEEVMSLLSMGSDDVRMIGIWGTGGLGKTTIAKDVYNNIFSKFDGCSFLPNVRETSSKPDGLVHLQKTLLSEISWKENLVVITADGGVNLIRDRLCSRKILLVLDDVDHGKQLNALAGECEWFGKGSRIIVTTRDKHVLTAHRIHHVYEVKPLNQGEAFELLSLYAFPRNQTGDISSDLIDKILGYANGLPLAIVVLGPLLCGRSREEWKSTLEKLAESPLKDINTILKLSVDALEDNEKDIFLDIACFFKGSDREYVTRVLDGCGLLTLIGIQTLIERSLVTIQDHGKVQMHDLIQLLGQDIVKKECLDDPGKRSRLWCYDDVFEVLSEATGTCAVKGIVLQLPIQQELDIGPSAFEHMRRLKLLIISNARFNGGPICLPNDLRWLECHGCHLSTLKFRDGPKKLVCFDVYNSQIKKFGGNLKDFNKLKFIDLFACPWLVCMPDLSCAPNLEKLHLYWCKNLERVHESIAYLGKLQSLTLSECPNLQSFPDFPIKNEALQIVYASNSGFKELPASIENLVSLKRLHLRESKKLATLPSSIYRLQNLEILNLEGCSKLIKFPKEEEDLSEPLTKTGFPKLLWLNLNYCHLSEVEFLENLSCFPCLQGLDLSGNNFTNLPKCERLNNLESLEVSDCQQLQEIPKIPRKLRWLEANNCESLNRMPSNIHDVEVVELYSSWGLDCNGFPGNDLFKLEKLRHQKNRQVVLPGREMPWWFLPNKEGYISFMATRDLYKKILGVAFCVVFQGEEEHSGFEFELVGSVNCKGTRHRRRFRPREQDHVWLLYMESKELWTVDHFGPNDSCHFHVSIRVANFQYSPSCKVIVKKCGFRLMCEPQENDLEVLLQDDSALLYEVSHEDNPMSTKEERSSEIEYLQNRVMCNMEYGLNMTDFSIEKHRYSSLEPEYFNREVRPGREMPKEFILVEDGTISFMASQDLYDKLIALYLCVVFGVEDGKKEASFNIVPYVNGQRWNELSGNLGPFDMDHVWLQRFTPHKLWGVLEGAVDFGQFSESYLRFSLNIRVAGVSVKKLGYVIQSCQLEDALKVEIEKNRLMDPASLYEIESSPWYERGGDLPFWLKVLRWR